MTPRALVSCLCAGLLLKAGVSNAEDWTSANDAAIDYAMSAAALSAAVSYCHAKHGPVYGQSRGGVCFEQAKQVVGTFDLARSRDEAKQMCAGSKALQTCITPQLGNMVTALMVLFDQEGL